MSYQVYPIYTNQILNYVLILFCIYESMSRLIKTKYLQQKTVPGIRNIKIKHQKLNGRAYLEREQG